MSPQKDFDTLVAQPWKVYRAPEEVLVDDSLSDGQKRRVLESWELDARELAVAEEENMGGGEPNMLDRVVRALGTLPAPDEKPRGPATMHGSQAAPSSAPGEPEEAGDSEAAAMLSPEEARQGKIVLNTPEKRQIFLGGIAACLAALAIAFWLA